MKRIGILIGLLTLVASAQAQCDYTTPRFNVESEMDVFYGVDTLFNGGVDSLFLNIYKPVNTEVDRPMIIWCFGGGFFAGARTDFDDVCQVMASQGYVAVTIDYRLGYIRPGGLNFPFSYDFREVPRAGYRAMQDLKGAIRYMKSRHLQDGVDLDNVYIGGGSAGAITALAAAFLDEESEKDPDVLGALPDADVNPPMPRPDLGPVEGRLHLGEHDATVAGVVNIFGAVFDTTQIRADDEEVVYSYHQTEDPIVPCRYDKAYRGFPFVPINMPYGYGSCMLDEHFGNLNKPQQDYKTYIHVGNQHAIHNEDLIFGEAFDFLEYHICDLRVNTSSTLFDRVNVYPNPTSSELVLQGWPEDQCAHLINSVGQKVGSWLPGSDQRLNVSQIPAGHYILIDDQSNFQLKVAIIR